MSEFFVGLDLGKEHDYSATVVVERRDLMRAFVPAKFDSLVVRHAERLPLGTPYAEVVEWTRYLVNQKELAGRCSLVLDGTGVGVSVLEMIQSARLGCGFSSVRISGGDREHSYSSMGGAVHSVPKQDLIACVQVLLEKEQLKIPRKLREAGALARELMDMRAKPGQQGKVRYGAEGSGEHDDLVIALALACWRAKRKTNGHVPYPLPGLGY